MAVQVVRGFLDVVGVPGALPDAIASYSLHQGLNIVLHRFVAGSSVADAADPFLSGHGGGAIIVELGGLSAVLLVCLSVEGGVRVILSLAEAGRIYRCGAVGVFELLLLHSPC